MRPLHSALLALLLLVDASGQNTASQPLQPADVLGSWQSVTCEALPDGRGDSQFRRREISFTPERWNFFATFFGDPSCTVPLFMARIEGPYRLGTLIASGATEADLYFQRLLFTALNEQAAEVLNSLGCGDADFQVGIEQDTSETGCVFPPTHEYPLEYDLVQIKDGLLYFGERPEENTLNRAENRPKVVNAFGLQQ